MKKNGLYCSLHMLLNISPPVVLLKMATIWVTHKIGQNIVFQYSIRCFKSPKSRLKIMPVCSDKCKRCFTFFFPLYRCYSDICRLLNYPRNFTKKRPCILWSLSPTLWSMCVALRYIISRFWLIKTKTIMMSLIKQTNVIFSKILRWSRYT